MTEPTFDNEIAVLRQILENPARMSCQYIDSTLDRYRLALQLKWKEAQNTKMNNKYIRDWSKQDQALL